MFDVLIVDDEPLARQSLRYLLDWEAHGFTIAAEAEDGLQALELMKTKYFSLVLTDIRMPRMDGLKFIEELRKFSSASAVVLSGYDDFEYARQGIRLGVQEYLLKPVDEDELIGVLRRMGTEIAEKERSGRQQRLGVAALRDSFFRKASRGSAGARELEDGAKLAEVEWQGKSAIALLVEMDSISDLASGYSEREEELKRFAVRNIMEELVQNDGYVFEESDERFGVALLTDGEIDLAESLAGDRAARIAESVRLYAKETVTIGLGSPADSFARFGQSFAAAERALDAKFLLGGGRILAGIETVVRDEASGSGNEDGEHAAWSAAYAEWEHRLLEAVRSFDREEARAAAEALMEITRAEPVPADRLRMDLLGLYVQLYQFVKQTAADSSSLFDPRQGDYEAIMKAKTVEELAGRLQKKCGDILEALQSAQELQPNKVAAAVMKIVDEQYASNISLRQVAKSIFLNPNYIGKLFKASTGKTFNEYLLQVRMEKAKDLLLRSDLKVYEIAQQVGYGELDWFYKKFKSYANISAGEFRARQTKP